MATITPSQRARHVEMILGVIDALPTLSPVAVQVLKLSGGDDTGLAELIRLIESDPSLTAKVLALTRRSDLGVARGIMSIERVVVLLGLDTLRAALLGAEVYEMFKPNARTRTPGGGDDEAPGDSTVAFDAAGFWRHSVSVACAAELFAERFRAQLRGIKPAEAYLCGLLHDLGKPALERTLPKTYERVLSLAQDGRSDLALIERRIIGVDHHTAGKRLAERWGLPHAIVDCMWLHGKATAAMPEIPHHHLVSLVTLADVFCRSRHLGFSGNLAGLDRLRESSAALGLDPDRLAECEADVIARVAQRSSALGLETVTDRDVLLESLAEANRRLTRLTAASAKPALTAPVSSGVLGAIEAFHAAKAKEPGLIGAVSTVAASAGSWLKASSIALLWRNRDGAPWQGFEFSCSENGAWNLRSSQEFPELPPISPESSVTLPIAEGGAAILLHNGTPLGSAAVPPALASTWAAAIRASGQHEGAMRLAERLVDATDRLAKAEETAARSRMMASLGEITAGAAHEMNNPLAVISGNAQLLSRKISNPNDYRNITAIVKASERLAELVQSLHLFASPTPPQRAECDLNDLVARACRDSRERCGMPSGHGSRTAEPALSIRAIVEPQARFARLDPAQISQSLIELVCNAIEAEPKSVIEVRVSVDPLDGRLLIAVRDDGNGMTQEQLDHAGDPFFSGRQAGRSTGLGLAKCRRHAELHGGTLTITSAPKQGTTTTMALDQWRSLSAPNRVTTAAA